MDERNFQDKLAELMDKIKQLPSEARNDQAQPGSDDRRNRVQSAIADLQDSLDHLRLSVKYLVFDLEATRRENAYLRRLIEQMNSGRANDQTRDADNSDNFLDDDQSPAD